MALIAQIVSANGDRIVEKRLAKGVSKLTIPSGAGLEFVNIDTGLAVKALSAVSSKKGLLLKFAPPHEDVLLELDGAISEFAEQPSDATVPAQGLEQDSGQDDGKAGGDQGAIDEGAAAQGGASSGMSPILLGVAAAGGIAAAAGGGGGKSEPSDTVSPSAPASLDVAAADDTGSSASDNITNKNSGITISGTAEAGARVELFDGATSLGTVTADSAGAFTLDVSLAAGVHAITAKATDAAGNVSTASSPLSITVDLTAPTAAIAIADTSLQTGETTTVTITFSEAVVGFTLDDLSLESGSLSNLASSDGGVTWTATLTPTADVADLTNVITLGTGYTDIAGNSGTAATSPNFAVETVSFTVVQGNDGTVSFGGTASGPITITLNAQDEAVFSRGGQSADTVISGISSKIMNVPEGGVLNIVIDGDVTSNTFTLDAPNAAALVFVGDGGGLSDEINVIIPSTTEDADLRDLRVDTSGLTGVQTIRFVFPEDAEDTVKLSADSDFTGLSTIEVSLGKVDLTAVTLPDGVEFIVNSTLILNLQQFIAMSTLVSVTGRGKLEIILTDQEIQSNALETFLLSDEDKPILIGTTVTVRDEDSQSLDVPEALDAIAYPGIPELSDRVDALEALLDDLDIDLIDGLSSTLTEMTNAISALQAAVGEQGELALRLDAIEGQLAGISDTVIAYVDAQIDELATRIDGLEISDVAGLAETLTGLDDALAALEASIGEDGEIGQRIQALESQLAGITDTVVAYVDAQIDIIKNDSEGEDGPSLDSIAGLRLAIEALLDGSSLGDPQTEGTLAYQLASLQAQIDAILEQIGGDTTAPTVIDIRLESATGADSDGHLNADDVVTATVHLSEAVVITGEPRLALTIGDGDSARTVYATLTGGAGTDTLTFSYTIGGEDEDATGISIPENALSFGEDGSIADGAGNLLDAEFESVADNDAFIIDNGPLDLTMSAADIFGGEDYANMVVVGLLWSGGEDGPEPVYLAEVEAEGEFIVPEGQFFLSMDQYLAALVSEGYEEFYNEEWFEANAAGGGTTIDFDLENALVLNVEGPFLLSEAALRALLNSEDGQETLDDADVGTVDEFITRYTIPLAELGASTTSVLSDDFLALIAGNDPADVRLEVTAPLTVAQATALAAAGFDMADHVDYRVRDYYTTVQAALANSDQKAALENSEQVIARGDELDNLVSMTAFNWNVNLRTELGAGDDGYNAGRGDEQIVGQHGADTINLTYNDGSSDTVIYQSVHDGRTGNVVNLRYSTDEDNYREGSRVSVTINGRVYDYTTGDDGDTPSAALENLAEAVMKDQVGDARVVIGVLYRFDEGQMTTGELVYQDDMVDGVYTVQQGGYFLSASDYLHALADNGNVDAQAVRYMGLRGGQSFTLTSEIYLEVESETSHYSDTLLEGQFILADGNAYSSFLQNYSDLYDYDAAWAFVSDSTRYNDVADVRVDGDTGTLTVIGASVDEDMAIEAGDALDGEDSEAIVNHGLATIVSIDFFTDEDDQLFPSLTNGENITQFDRELRITIDGKTITANIIPGEPVGSVSNLVGAISAAINSGATNAITAATATIDLETAMSEDAAIGSYDVTLVINGRTVTISSEAGGTLGDLIDAIGAIGGVQSVALDGQNLVITGEVRGSVAADNFVQVQDFTIDNVPYGSSSTEAVGGSLNGLVFSVDSDGTTITLTGAIPETDQDAPTITIDSAEIDQAGTQQVVDVTFSSDDADYYEGGTLSVTVNGEDISADMVMGEDGGDAYASLLALAAEINLAAGEDSELLIERAYVDGEDGDWSLHIVSSVEAPDALEVTAVEQSYRGEEQTATITLEDALTYTAQAGEDAGSANRFADVYFEGGQVHATFVPRVSDGQGGLTDGEPVTVSADMVTKPGTSSYSMVTFSPTGWIGSYGSNIFGISVTIDGVSHQAEDFVAYLAEQTSPLALAAGDNFDVNATATFTDLANWLETLDGVKGVSIDETGIAITYETGVTGTIDAVSGMWFAAPNDGPGIVLDDEANGDIANVEAVGDPVATAQALADAINAETQQVVHFNFLMGESDPLTLETLVETEDNVLVTLDVSVNGVGGYYDIFGNEDGGIETVGDLIDWLNGEYAGVGTWSLNATGTGFDLTVAADAVVLVDSNISIGLLDDALVSSSSIDEATLPFIGGAVSDGTSITVTAAEVGKDTFRVDDVKLDYEGVHQIATATFDSDDDYYDGGTLSVEIDTTPGVEGGLVRVQANMVAGDREASLQNLADEINSYVAAGNTAARIVLTGSETLSETTSNQGDELDGGLYVGSWSVTVGTGSNAVTYSGRGEAVTVSGEQDWNAISGETVFEDLGGFLTYLSGLAGIDSATLDENGNIVITTEATGSDAYVSASFDIALFADTPSSPHLTSSRSDCGSSGALNGVVGHAEVDGNGTITLVSDDAVREQFLITDAEISKQPVQQRASADYNGSDSAYYEGGKVGMVVNGVTVEVDMVVNPARTTISISDLSATDLLGGQIFDFGGGSNSWVTVNFSLTVAGAEYDEDDFAQYLSELSSPLTLRHGNEVSFDAEDMVTFQHLADWVETLEGVSGVTIASDGLTIAFDDGVAGEMDFFTGAVFHDVDTPVSFGTVNDEEGAIENKAAGGDSDATIEALRDAIWAQVTRASLTIDIDDDLELTDDIGLWSTGRPNISGAESNGLNTTLGDLLAGIETLEGVESAKLIDGKIVITAEPGQAPFLLTIGTEGLGNFDEQVGNDLYGAFSSVQANDEGDINFVAADAVDGYGEINISDVFMSVRGKEQITEIDFDSPSFANGLRDEGDHRAQMSVSIAGQTITAALQDNDQDSIRALAQAIIEARDGTFVKETITVGSDDLAATVEIDLPSGVEGETRLVNDGADYFTALSFSVSFAVDGPVFTYEPGATFDMTIDEMIADINGQIADWAADESLDQSDVGSFAYDPATNLISVTSNAVGTDAYVNVSGSIYGFWEPSTANIQSELNNQDVALEFGQEEAVTAGAGDIRFNVTTDDGVFFTEDSGGPITIEGQQYAEVLLAEEVDGWSNNIRFEMHLTFLDSDNQPVHWDYYSGDGDDHPEWLGLSEAYVVAGNGSLYLSEVLAYLNQALAADLGSVGTISLDPSTGQILIEAAPGYTVELGGADRGVGNDFRLDVSGSQNFVVEKSLIINDNDAIRVDLADSLFTGGTGGHLIDGEYYAPDVLAINSGGTWEGLITGFMHLDFDNGSAPTTFSLSLDGGPLELMAIDQVSSGGIGDDIITLADLVTYMNEMLTNFEEGTDLGTISLQNGQIVITPADGTTVNFGAAGSDAGMEFAIVDYLTSPHLIEATESYTENGSLADSVPAGLADTFIDLPTYDVTGDFGVTGGSIIRGIDGGYFNEAEAAIDIRVTFTVAGEDFEFSGPTDLDENMTVEAFIEALNERLTDFEDDQQTGDLGTFSFADDQIVFTPAELNADLTSYQINAFNISGFAEMEVLATGGGTASYIFVDNESDEGESDVIVMHSDSRAITEADPISMDLVTVSFTIDGEEQTLVFRPDLIETPGAVGPTIGDFLEWVHDEFDVSGSIINGDIVFSGEGLEAADVSLELLDAWRTVSSSAVSETVPVSGASGGSITLEAYAGLDGDTVLGGETIDFEIFVGGATAGEIISFSYEVEPGSTIQDLLDYIEAHAASETNDTPFLSASIDETGIVLSVSGQFAVDRLWVSELSLTVEQERTGIVTQVAAVLGEVDFDGEDGIILHADDVGPDPLTVGSVSYDRVDVDNSEYQRVTVEFTNSKLDGITNGSVVSLTLLGKTTSITVSTDGSPENGELDLSGTTPNSARSSVILDALIQRLYNAHSSDPLGTIERGYLDGDGVFILDNSGTSNVLRITADYYGQNALGDPQDILATVVDALDVNQLSQTAEEERPGKVSFISSSSDVDVENNQAGRNDSIIHYVHSGGEYSDGSYILVDGASGGTGVYLDDDADDEFSYLDIDDTDEEGVGPGTENQSYTNPGGATGYYGDGGATGQEGVGQTYQNPDGSYTATDGSPVTNEENVSAGDDTLYGGASGSYDLDGLHTDHVDGATPTSENTYDDETVDASTGTTGAYQGELTDGASADDGFDSEVDQEGFAAFTWDYVIQSTVAAASAGPDIINHFQVSEDVIGFEGAIEESSVDGYVSHRHAIAATGGIDFDLDEDEFGLVSSDVSWLDADKLDNAEWVSAMLSVFDTSAGGEDGELNSSIFAITASDDNSVTAIWAHTQSSEGDDTIDANELTLLAMVNTIGGEFSYQNLQMMHHTDPI